MSTTSTINVDAATFARIYEKPVKVSPTYLVTADDPSVKGKVQQWLAIKLDEMPATIKFVGFETSPSENFDETWQETLKSADRSIYKEMQVPWARVIKIQNLIYKIK